MPQIESNGEVLEIRAVHGRVALSATDEDGNYATTYVDPARVRISEMHLGGTHEVRIVVDGEEFRAEGPEEAIRAFVDAALAVRAEAAQ